MEVTKTGCDFLLLLLLQTDLDVLSLALSVHSWGFVSFLRELKTHCSTKTDQ